MPHLQSQVIPRGGTTRSPPLGCARAAAEPHPVSLTSVVFPSQLLACAGTVLELCSALPTPLARSGPAPQLFHPLLLSPTAGQGHTELSPSFPGSPPALAVTDGSKHDVTSLEPGTFRLCENHNGEV